MNVGNERAELRQTGGAQKAEVSGAHCCLPANTPCPHGSCSSSGGAGRSLSFSSSLCPASFTVRISLDFP